VVEILIVVGVCLVKAGVEKMCAGGMPVNQHPYDQRFAMANRILAIVAFLMNVTVALPATNRKAAGGVTNHIGNVIVPADPIAGRPVLHLVATASKPMAVEPPDIVIMAPVVPIPLPRHI